MIVNGDYLPHKQFGEVVVTSWLRFAAEDSVLNVHWRAIYIDEVLFLQLKDKWNEQDNENQSTFARK